MSAALANDIAVDLTALPVSYAGGRQLHELPPIWLFHDFASDAEIHALIAAAKNRMAPAEVSGEDSGFISKGRSNYNGWVAHDCNDLTLQLAGRIAALVGIPLINAESFQVVHYDPAQQYGAHFDGWDAGTERGDRCMARGGQRLITALLYLNDVAAGGATRFTKLDLDVQPVKGSLLLFHNCHPGTARRHELSMHAGLPVTLGEKWAANLWFRQRDYRWQAQGAAE
ncbi:MAG TPA: 2OG-Fe(II) oxygenase [Candidatus Acidoferrum sp.]|nr:2OG-Fe(II) oxygenase [Candidatus Acidoferrum sp.]